jgi:hypothetical protein
MVRRHGSQAPASFQSPIGIFEAHVAFERPAKWERAEGDMPDASVDVLEADIFAKASMGDVDPLRVPPHSPMGPDVAPLETVGVFKRGQSVGYLTGCGVVA